MDYEIDEIFVDENNNIVFNGIDIISDNENAIMSKTTINYTDNSTDMTNYVLKEGDIMTGQLSVPSLKINNQISNAFTNTYIDYILASQSALTNMGYEESINTTVFSDQVFIENLSCNNINTSHLNSTSSNLQTQINSLKNRIVALEAVVIPYIPVGTILIYAQSSPAPDGYLMCHGALVSRTTYADLYAVIGNTYSNLRSTTTDFYLPDLRQCYVKGAGDNKTYSITAAETTLGQFQFMSVQKHRHQIVDNGSGTKTVSTYNLSSDTVVADDTTDTEHTLADIFSPSSNTIFDNETRGNCLSMNFIIKF
jgi:microcystin-dependent protein